MLKKVLTQYKLTHNKFDHFSSGDIDKKKSPRIVFLVVILNEHINLYVYSTTIFNVCSKNVQKKYCLFTLNIQSSRVGDDNNYNQR